MASASPEREHDGRAGSGREIQRTGFLLDVHIEKDVRILREGRVRVAANGDDLDLKPRDGGQDPQQFLRLAAGAQGEDDVAVGHHAEVAVQRVQGIEHHRGRTGAGEGRGDLVPDVARFSHAEHHDFAARLDRFLDQVDRLGKIVVQAVAQPLELKNLHVENASSLFKIVHRPMIVRSGVRAGKKITISRISDSMIEHRTETCFSMAG